jgi:hypothetical protein
MSNSYYLFGLTIASALPLPAVAVESVPTPDVVIEYGATPEELTAPQVAGVRFQAAPGEFLLRVDNVARFYVQGGNRITITPVNGSQEADILSFLMGSATGALLQQRQVLVLHGSAIEVNGESVLFCGPSGVGKSTLAAGFHKRGYPFLADDLCAIGTHHGRPSVIPGFPRLKLWADSLKRLDTAHDDLERVRWGTDLQKYFLPAENSRENPVPVRAVFILSTSNKDHLELTSLTGSEKIEPLIRNSYRMRFLEGLGGKNAHFKQCAAIAAAADVCRVVRPLQGFMLDELMDLLAERLA